MKRRTEEIMKRTELKDFQGRVMAKGKIERFGLRKAYNEHILTILMVDLEITDGERQVALDHVWFKYNKKLDERQLKVGNELTFTCLIKPYSKEGIYSQSYGISRVRDAKVIKEGNGVYIDQYQQMMIKMGVNFTSNVFFS